VIAAPAAGDGATPAARRILVTGAAGFIGAAVCQRLLARGDAVLGYDNLNDYYEVSLKQARLDRLASLPRFGFRRAALEDHASLDAAFAEFRPQRVVHLAAQAGVGQCQPTVAVALRRIDTRQVEDQVRAESAQGRPEMLL
jgi:nucleoside-diphosphate-sugar epimerase